MLKNETLKEIHNFTQGLQIDETQKNSIRLFCVELARVEYNEGNIAGAKWAFARIGKMMSESVTIGNCSGCGNDHDPLNHQNLKLD